MTDDDGAAVARWWASLATAALVGTARSAVPAPPPLGLAQRDGATPEAALLDAAALAAAVRDAGRVPVQHDRPVDEAGPDAAAPAPERAAQLLDLLLGQAPVGKDLQTRLLEVWFTRAADVGVRVPHELLPAVLTAATQRPELRPAARRTLDERGRWLAGRRAAWRWAVSPAADDDAPPADEVWLRLPGPEQEATLRRIRTQDPARGRLLLAQVLPTVGAKQRATLLPALAVGLCAEDEPLLESLLDDRAATVRAAACTLLDHLPSSARAARMAERLRSLLRVGGVLRKALEVADMPAADDAARRDGLGDVPTGRRRDDVYLETIVAGAPLTVLTEVCRTDPDGVLRLDRDGVLLPGLLRAVPAQRDRTWATALLAQVWHPSLLGVLPQAEREAEVVRALRRPDGGTEAVRRLAWVPGPWTPELSEAAGDLAARLVAGGGDTPWWDPAPLVHLHPASVATWRRAHAAAEAAEATAARALAGRPDGPRTPGADPLQQRLAAARHSSRVLRDAVQCLTFIGLIDEALT